MMRSKFFMTRYVIYIALTVAVYYYVIKDTGKHSRIKHRIQECRPNQLRRDRPVVIEGRQSQPKCAVDCRYQYEGPFDLSSNGYLLTMESSVYYPNTAPDVVRKDGKIALTPRLDSDVPVGYFSWAEYGFMDRVPEQILQDRLKTLSAYADGDKSEPLAVAVISNCAANTFRLQAVEQLKAAGVPISTYGTCFPGSPPLPHSQDSKIDQLRKHPFTLAFENSVEEDYVTEKFWHGLVAGSVPIVIGCDNAFDFDPIDTQVSSILGGGMIRIPSLTDIPKVVKVLNYLSQNHTAYLDMLKWKLNGPSNKFLALVDMAVVHSECRLCIYVGTRELNQENQCSCMQDGQGKLRLLVRERGRFNFVDVFVDVEAMEKAANKVQYLNFLIKDAFAGEQPIWVGHRQDFKSSAHELKLYKVYPASATQREALYGNAAIDTDLKIEELLQKPCPQLEVIFV